MFNPFTFNTMRSLHGHNYHYEQCIKEFLDGVLTPKIVVNTVPRKDLMILLPCLAKLSLQISLKIYHAMENKLPYCNLQILFQIKCKLIIFSHLKIKFLFTYVPALFIKISVVAAVPTTVVELRAILKSECVSNLEFHVLL